MINRHFTTSFTVSRHTVDGYKKTFAQVSTFKGHIQPLNPTYEQGTYSRLANEFKLFAPADADVVIGDRLNDGTRDYDVVGHMVKSFNGKSHAEMIVKAYGD